LVESRAGGECKKDQDGERKEKKIRTGRNKKVSTLATELDQTGLRGGGNECQAIKDPVLLEKEKKSRTFEKRWCRQSSSSARSVQEEEKGN